MPSDQTDSNYTVLDFSETNLLAAFQLLGHSEAQIRKSAHYNYFCRYFNYKSKDPEANRNDGFHASKIVIEHTYVCEAFLKDYSYFYSTCFKEYAKYTRRIHFFEAAFTAKEFEEAIIEDSVHPEIWKSYLGYIVIKPLVNSLIGATLIKPYPSYRQKKRHFNSIVQNEITIFGKTIRDFEAVFFQQQDQAVSACATNALWSAFHTTSTMFHTPFPAPSQITKSAGFYSDGGRVFPNDWLENRQISQAIEHVGLVAEMLVRTEENNPNPVLLQHINLKRLIHAYNKSGLPLLLGFEVGEKGGDNHLVTIIGYRIDAETENLYHKISKVKNIFKRREPLFHSELNLYADRIKRIYVHDDQIGPYSKIGIDPEGNDPYKLKIQWIDQNYKSGFTVSLIIAVLSTIRVKFEKILAAIRELNLLIIQNALNNYFDTIKSKLSYEYDIYLSSAENYKYEVRNDTNIKETAVRRKIMITTYPKYIWVVRLYTPTILGDEIIIDRRYMDLIYDASDIPSGHCLFQINYYDENFKISFAQETENYFKYTYPLLNSIQDSEESLKKYKLTKEDRIVLRGRIISDYHYKFILESFSDKEYDLYMNKSL